MTTFNCPNCQKLLSAGEELAGQQLACPQCGQAVLLPGLPLPSRPPVGRRPAPSPRPPRYLSLRLLAGLLTGSGLVCLGLGIVMFYLTLRIAPERQPPWTIPATCALVGIVYAGLGELLLAVRDIARNSWHWRN